MTRRNDKAELTKQTHEFREFLVRGGIEKAFDIPPKIEEIFKDAYHSLKKSSYNYPYWSVVIGEWKKIIELLLEEDVRSRSARCKSTSLERTYKSLMKGIKGMTCESSELASSIQIDEERREFREFLQGHGISSFLAIPDDFLEMLCRAFHEIRYDVCHNWKETLQTWQKIVALLSVVNTSNKNVKEFREEFKEPPIDRSNYTYDRTNACRLSPRKELKKLLDGYDKQWWDVRDRYENSIFKSAYVYRSFKDKDKGLEHVSVWDSIPTDAVNNESKSCVYICKIKKNIYEELVVTNCETNDKRFFVAGHLHETILSDKSNAVFDLPRCGIRAHQSLKNCINAYAILELLRLNNKDHGFTLLNDGTYDMDENVTIYIKVDNESISQGGLFERLGFFCDGRLTNCEQDLQYTCANGLVIRKMLEDFIIIRKDTRSA